jgi:hypothetical protein
VLCDTSTTEAAQQLPAIRLAAEFEASRKRDMRVGRDCLAVQWCRPRRAHPTKVRTNACFAAAGKNITVAQVDVIASPSRAKSALEEGTCRALARINGIGFADVLGAREGREQRALDRNAHLRIGGETRDVSRHANLRRQFHRLPAATKPGNPTAARLIGLRSEMSGVSEPTSNSVCDQKSCARAVRNRGSGNSRRSPGPALTPPKKATCQTCVSRASPKCLPAWSARAQPAVHRRCWCGYCRQTGSSGCAP